MPRYDINIDCPFGARVAEATLREVLPEWIEAKDEAEAEAMIAAALSRWAENRHARILEHVTVWPSRVHVRERAYRSGYGHPPTPRVRILARRRVHDVPTGPWLHLGDDHVPSRVSTGILADWRWLGRTEDTWFSRPWDTESWEWVADAPSPTDPPSDPEPRLEVWLALDPDEQWHHVVTLVDPASGDEMTTLSYHRHQPDAIARARRESVQLRLPLLVPSEQEATS